MYSTNMKDIFKPKNQFSKSLRLRNHRKGLCYIAALALVLTAINCRNDSEILATYEGGTVTRGEFRQLFKMTHNESAAKKAGIQQQSRMLRSYAISKIAAAAASKEGLEKSEDFKKEFPLLKERIQVEAFSRYLQEEKSDRSFKMVELQVLFLRNPGKNSNAKKGPHDSAGQGPGARAEEAKGLLAKLNSGLSDEQIASLISQKTEQMQSRIAGGLQQPICVNCADNRQAFLTGPAEKAPSGKFIHITNISGGEWLVRRLGGRTLEDSDLEGYLGDFYHKEARLAKEYLKQHKELKNRRIRAVPLEDKQIAAKAKQQSQLIVSREKRNAFYSYITRLKQNKKFVLHEGGHFLPGKKPDAKYTDSTPLFEIDGKSYTYGDLCRVFPAEKYNLDRQLQMLGLIQIIELLKGDPEFEKSLTTDSYSRYKKLRTDEALGKFYISRDIPEIKVDAQKVRKYYEQKKKTMFKGKSFNSVKGDIERMLKRRFGQTALQGSRGKLARKYKLKINKKVLKAGDI